MDAKLKAKWIKALRSGRYKQTQGALRNRIDDAGRVGYCCLGVLCKVAKITINSKGDACSHHRDYKPIYAAVGTPEANALMGLNDRERKSFAYIATRIEKNI